jgi:hypothetical protein
MTGMAASHRRWKTISLVWLTVGIGLFVLVAANTHLLYVAVSSQPECVVHLRHGEGNGKNSFSAATSSCSAQTPAKAKTQVE